MLSITIQLSSWLFVELILEFEGVMVALHVKLIGHQWYLKFS